MKLSKLANIAAMMKSLDKEIAIREQQSGIAGLREQKTKLATEYNKEMKVAASSVQFVQDRISRSAYSYREGKYKLVRSSRTVRSVVRELFVKDHKDLALQICTIPVGDAEKALGSLVLDKYVDKKTTYTYEFQILNVE